jgi:branched-chain amino acid aminotransferase
MNNLLPVPICATWRLPASAPYSLVRCSIDPQPRTLDDASLRLPGGAYTTFRTYHHNQAFHLIEHFQRLEESARLAGRPLFLDREAIRAGICRALDAFPAEDTRIRLSLDLEQTPGDVYISLEKLHTPAPREYVEGVRVVTLYIHRENPQAKLTNFIAQASQARRNLPAGVAEGLMLDAQSQVLEGLSSNFFGVLDGEIYTTNQAVLSGITRALVLDEAARAGIKIHLVPLPYAEIERFSEAFITSSSRAVLPVVMVDSNAIGSGRPGPLTLDLLARYIARIERDLAPI